MAFQHLKLDKVVDVILTGTNVDGSKGLRNIKTHNGLNLVQDPDEIKVETMPRAAIEIAGMGKTFSLRESKLLLLRLSNQ